MTEAELMSVVLEAARWLNYWAYHTHDSRRSEPGFPDLVLVNRSTGHTLFRELKTDKGKLTAAQRDCLALLAIRNDVAVWRPADWVSGAILADLRGTRTQATA